MTKYTEIRGGIGSMIECNSIDKTDDKPGEYGKDFLKVKFISDDSLPLNKILKLHVLTVISRSVFKKNGKYYPQSFLDEGLYKC